METSLNPLQLVKVPAISKELKYGILGIGGALAANYFITKYKRQQTYKEAFTNPAVGFAQRLADAMNPSGYSWLDGLDGTNNTEVQNVASEVKAAGLEKQLVEAYKNMFGTELINDLRKEGALPYFNKGLNGSTVSVQKPSNTSSSNIITDAITAIGSIFGGSKTPEATTPTGKVYLYKADANVRRSSYPYDIIATGKKGSEAGTLEKFVDKSINISGTWKTVRFASLIYKNKSFLVDSANIVLKGGQTQSNAVTLKIGDTVKYSQVCNVRSIVSPYGVIGTAQVGVTAGVIKEFKDIAILSNGKTVTTKFAKILFQAKYSYVAVQFLKK